MKTTLTLILSLALVGCATVPKPQELLDLEALQESKQYRRAEEDHPDLIDESKSAHSKSVASWEDEEIEKAKHWAILATIKVNTARAIMDQKTARQKVEDARKELAKLQEEQKTVAAKITETDEQLALMDKLAAARKAAREKEEALKAKLTEAQKREREQKKAAEAQKKLAEAAQKLGEAEVALKMAETVQAAKYAKPEYDAALSLVARAKAALKAKKPTDVLAISDMAKKKAEAAAAAARPKYQAAKKTAAQQARNQALQKDAAAIPGTTVKMKTVGQTQQLILPVKNLFKRGKTNPRPEKAATLTSIGALLKKYKEYPVIVNGYTSHRVRRSQRVAVSQARAQNVANGFAAQGVDLKRLAVAGHGAENLVARRWSTINDRVEVVILVQ